MFSDFQKLDEGANNERLKVLSGQLRKVSADLDRSIVKMLNAEQIDALAKLISNLAKVEESLRREWPDAAELGLIEENDSP